MNWNQPVCAACWDFGNIFRARTGHNHTYETDTRREPVRIVSDLRTSETCCNCGDPTPVTASTCASTPTPCATPKR